MRQLIVVVFMFVCIAAFSWYLNVNARAEEINDSEAIISGTVQEIAVDKSYIVVDNERIATEKDFFEWYKIEIGEAIEIVAQKTGDGLKAVTCWHVLEEEQQPAPAPQMPETE